MRRWAIVLAALAAVLGPDRAFSADPSFATADHSASCDRQIQIECSVSASAGIDGTLFAEAMLVSGQGGVLPGFGDGSARAFGRVPMTIPAGVKALTIDAEAFVAEATVRMDGPLRLANPFVSPSFGRADALLDIYLEGLGPCAHCSVIPWEDVFVSGNEHFQGDHHLNFTLRTSDGSDLPPGDVNVVVRASAIVDTNSGGMVLARMSATVSPLQIRFDS